MTGATRPQKNEYANANRIGPRPDPYHGCGGGRECLSRLLGEPEKSTESPRLQHAEGDSQVDQPLRPSPQRREIPAKPRLGARQLGLEVSAQSQPVRKEAFR